MNAKSKEGELAKVMERQKEVAQLEQTLSENKVEFVEMINSFFL